MSKSAKGCSEQNNESGKCATDEESGATGYQEDGCHELYKVLNSIGANLDQLADNSRDVYERINQLEMDCIDLLQPLGDIIALERELKKLSEIESNYINMLRENQNI